MNIANLLDDQVFKLDQKVAIVKPGKGEITFGELYRLSNSYANGLSELGVKKGDKTLIFVKPSLQFHALVFSLYKVGAIPVFIDPGMGMKNLLSAIKEVKPKVLIAEPIVHILKKFYSGHFSSIDIQLSTKAIFGIKGINSIDKGSYQFENVEFEPDEMCAILFTSGGTGRPKGVVYSHQIFIEQTRILKELFSLNENEIDLPGFPLFSLFTICMGMTSIIPDMNPSKPGKANPRKLVQNIINNKVTFVAGSPAIWKPVAKYCLENRITLPTVKYLVMFGAPISNKMHEDFSKILVNGNTYTPYGATESLPVACIDGKTVLSKTALETEQGKGTCVGKPVKGVDVKVIKISDDAITQIQDIQELGPYEIGEFIIKGKVVTKKYYNSEKETSLSKIKDGDQVWHRIGDVGYFDEFGQIWFCGRKSHRVESNKKVYFSIPCESLLNQHPLIEKSALINTGVGAGFVIEKNRKLNKRDKLSLTWELRQHVAKFDQIRDIEHFYFKDQLPVDIRHNIKIDRIKLSKQAQQRRL